MTIDRAAAARFSATDRRPSRFRTLSTNSLPKPAWRICFEAALLFSLFALLAVVLLGVWLSMMQANFWN